MQPNQPLNQQRDGFLPKWRNFAPQDRIWISNPFSHDVVFQVADEFNRPFQYRLQAHKVSELPGGAIATLGVKAIVDELIMSDKDDSARMWEPGVRKKHEDAIILREKRSIVSMNTDKPGEIDLSVQSDDAPELAEEEQKQPEQAFPGLNQELPKLAPLPQAANQELDALVSASLPKSNTVIEQ